jgi:hypothetical protein
MCLQTKGKQNLVNQVFSFVKQAPEKEKSADKKVCDQLATSKKA